MNPLRALTAPEALGRVFLRVLKPVSLTRFLSSPSGRWIPLEPQSPCDYEVQGTRLWSPLPVLFVNPKAQNGLGFYFRFCSHLGIPRGLSRRFGKSSCISQEAAKVAQVTGPEASEGMAAGWPRPSLPGLWRAHPRAPREGFCPCHSPGASAPPVAAVHSAKCPRQPTRAVHAEPREPPAPMTQTSRRQDGVELGAQQRATPTLPVARPLPTCARRGVTHGCGHATALAEPSHQLAQVLSRLSDPGPWQRRPLREVTLVCAQRPKTDS